MEAYQASIIKAKYMHDHTKLLYLIEADREIKEQVIQNIHYAIKLYNQAHSD